MAVALSSETGWVSLGFPSSAGQMIGATAVIATSSAPNGVGIYDLNSKDLSGVQLSSSSSSGRRLANTATLTPAQISKVRLHALIRQLLYCSFCGCSCTGRQTSHL